MERRCPDCLSSSKFDSDSPSSFWESVFQSIGLIRVKRCRNCNAAIFVAFGLYVTSRKKMRILRERSYWLFLSIILVTVGFLIVEAMAR